MPSFRAVSVEQYECLVCKTCHDDPDKAHACCLCTVCKQRPSRKAVTTLIKPHRCELCHARREFDAAHSKAQLAVKTRQAARATFKRDCKRASEMAKEARKEKRYWADAIKKLVREGRVKKP
jgi:L-lactate utilization protein LutB